jgi:hypothetical protein
MRFSSCSAIAVALALTLSGPGAYAQEPSAQDHNAHHPQGAAPAPMKDGMGGMKMGQSGMMCTDMMGASPVEGRIAVLKTALQITEMQTSQWDRFAESLRASGKAMSDVHRSMLQPMPPAKPLPDQLAAREQMMAAHLASVKAMREALAPLYASFTDDQKKLADTLMIGPMGMM